MSLVATNRNSTTTPLPQTDLDNLNGVKAKENKSALNIIEPTATTAQSIAASAYTDTVKAIVAQSTSETVNIVDLSAAEIDVETATTVLTATTLPTATNVPTATTVPAATTLPAETVLTTATNGDEEKKLLLLTGGKDAAGKPYTHSELVGQYRWAPQFSTLHGYARKIYPTRKTIQIQPKNL
jgi:hypothetical protein